MTTNFGAKCANLADPTAHPHSSHWCAKTIARSQSLYRRFNGNDSATLCKNLVSFGPVTPEVTTLEIVTFGGRCSEISECTELFFTKLS